jgi:hypothetical protein
MVESLTATNETAAGHRFEWLSDSSAPAMIGLDDLAHAPILVGTGPTGRSAYWEDLFSVLHPQRSTTDVAFNLVDAVWLPREPVHVRIYLGDLVGQTVAGVEDWMGATTPLRHIVRNLREQVPLPAADLAAMLGLRRRQFYNLISGSRASSERERWIRKVAAGLERLRDAGATEPSVLRAALLHPLLDGRSLYDRACSLDEAGLTEAENALAEALNQRLFSSHLSLPSPRLRGRGSASEASAFLSGYRDGSDERD